MFSVRVRLVLGIKQTSERIGPRTYRGSGKKQSGDLVGELGLSRISEKSDRNRSSIRALKSLGHGL